MGLTGVTAVATVISGTVTGITIINPGSGYLIAALPEKRPKREITKKQIMQAFEFLTKGLHNNGG